MKEYRIAPKELSKDKTSSEIDAFIDKLYELRQNSIEKDGEYGIGNLVFKAFRNEGLLDNLRELKKIEISKELSLENLKN